MWTQKDFATALPDWLPCNSTKPNLPVS